MTKLATAEACPTPEAAAAEIVVPDAAQQPAIAGVLGIAYPTPISDTDGWARVFAEPSQARAAFP